MEKKKSKSKNVESKFRMNQILETKGKHKCWDPWFLLILVSFIKLYSKAFEIDKFIFKLKVFWILKNFKSKELKKLQKTFSKFKAKLIK